jgi:hypothetical protein
MIDSQYQEFINNFTVDLKFVLSNMIELMQLNEDNDVLKFENIINTLLEDKDSFYYLTDYYSFKVTISLELNFYEIKLSLSNSCSPKLFIEMADKLYEINEFSIAKFKVSTQKGADFLIYYP